MKKDPKQGKYLLRIVRCAVMAPDLMLLGKDVLPLRYSPASGTERTGHNAGRGWFDYTDHDRVDLP